MESSVFGNVDIAENPICSDPQHSNKIKERSSVEIGKKVSFNLNVPTYGPLSKDESIHHLPESGEEDDRREKNGADTAKRSLSFVSESDSTASQMNSIPSNYRYQNLADSYEDEDDMANMESDLDDEEGEDENEEDECEDEDGGLIDTDDLRIRQSDYFKQPNAQPMESAQRISWIHSAEVESNNNMQLPGSTNGELKFIELKRNARNRSQFVNSVLNPVENLTKWKVVKARIAPPKHLRKENISLQQEPSVSHDQHAGSNLYLFSIATNCNQLKPLWQEVAVDASLSKWIASPNSSDYKSPNVAAFLVRRFHQREACVDSSCSQHSIEDRPILDVANFKA